ncbi:MAG: ABC transporter permease subunit [Lachnospiraceae bacterium]|nr:ABC transporter permease subunit [Lachnospiraceae bacterium]
MSPSSRIRKIVILLFWVAIWQTAAQLIDNSIVFVGPYPVLCALFNLLPTPGFWLSVGSSLGKISLGFLAAFLCGLAIGCLAYHFTLLREFLEPIIRLMKSVPVASFVILALIGIGSENLAVFISFLVVFPILYVNTIAGLENTDQKLLEMAQIFSVTPAGRFRCIYLPALLPYLTSGCRIALGMSWKSGIAAEVIGIPSHTIGENLYMAKIYLSTAELLAWTIVIILISALFEKVFLLLLEKGVRLCFRFS